MAAEAEFLTAHRWIPHSVQSAIPQMEQTAIVMWRGPSGKLYGQGEAVRIAKIGDPYFSSKDYSG